MKRQLVIQKRSRPKSLVSLTNIVDLMAYPVPLYFVSDAVTVSKSGAIIRTAVIVSSVVGLVILLIILVIIHKKYPKVFKIFDVLDLCKEEGEGSGE